jgi:hypothetical protein
MQNMENYMIHTHVATESVRYRGGFIVKLIKLKLQGTSLARDHSKTLGWSLSNALERP